MAERYDTPESLADLSVAHPEIAELMAAMPAMPKTPIPIEKRRIGAQGLLKDFIGNYSNSETLMIPMRDGHQSQLRLYRPDARRRLPEAETPLVVLIHGGAFVMCDNTHLNPIARALSSLYKSVVVCPSYRLAPEHRFPTAAWDCWDSLQWIAAHPHELGASPSAGFVVGGVSAGANLTAVTCQRAVAENLSPPLTGMWVSQPFLLDFKTVPESYKDVFLSREQNHKSVILNADALENMRQEVGLDTSSPDFSPFNISGAHKGMPPSVIDIAGKDPLRDDGLIYERELRNHGVSTKLLVYPGVPHGFWAAFRKSKIARDWEVDVITNLGWLLGQSTDVASIGSVLDRRNEA